MQRGERARRRNLEDRPAVRGRRREVTESGRPVEIAVVSQHQPALRTISIPAPGKGVQGGQHARGRDAKDGAGTLGKIAVDDPAPVGCPVKVVIASLGQRAVVGIPAIGATGEEVQEGRRATRQIH